MSMKRESAEKAEYTAHPWWLNYLSFNSYSISDLTPALRWYLILSQLIEDARMIASWEVNEENRITLRGKMGMVGND